MFGAFCALVCAATIAITGSTVTVNGHLNGTYVDDTTPNRCEVAASTPGLVIVAEAPTFQAPCPTGLNVREWYPYDCRFFPGAWGPIPNSRAYILQDRFAWPGCPPPTSRQRHRLLLSALKHHPTLILWN